MILVVDWLKFPESLDPVRIAAEDQGFSSVNPAAQERFEVNWFVRFGGWGFEKGKIVKRYRLKYQEFESLFGKQFYWQRKNKQGKKKESGALLSFLSVALRVNGVESLSNFLKLHPDSDW